MALHSFCGILTLQVGVAMIAVVFWTIAALTFVVNFFEFIESVVFPVYCLTISLFVILLIMGGLIAFFGAYNESNGLCMAGVALTALTTVLWVTVSSFSFYNDAVFLQYVCVHDRCPETFWLAPLKYRLEGTQDNLNKNSSDYPSNFTAQSLNNSKSDRKKRGIYSITLTPLVLQQDNNVVMNETEFHNDEIWNPEFDGLLDYLDDNVDDVPNSQVDGTGYKFGIDLIGAVVLFICNFFFFLFSILVLWSYGQELAWTNEYLSDIPEYASP